MTHCVEQYQVKVQLKQLRSFVLIGISEKRVSLTALKMTDNSDLENNLNKLSCLMDGVLAWIAGVFVQFVG